MSPMDFENLAGLARDRNAELRAAAKTDHDLRRLHAEQTPTDAPHTGPLDWLRRHVHIGHWPGGTSHGGHLPQHG